MKDTKKTAVKKPSRTARMFQLVIAGFSNETAVRVIKKEYGKDVPTNTASIGWCRTQLKAKTDYAKKHNPRGVKVPTDAEAKANEAKKAKTAPAKPAAPKTAPAKPAAPKPTTSAAA